MSNVVEEWTEKGNYSALKGVSNEVNNKVEKYNDLKQQESKLNTKLQSIADSGLSDYETDAYKELIKDKKSDVVRDLEDLKMELDSKAITEVVGKIKYGKPRSFPYTHYDVKKGIVKYWNKRRDFIVIGVIVVFYVVLQTLVLTLGEDTSFGAKVFCIVGLVLLFMLTVAQYSKISKSSDAEKCPERYSYFQTWDKSGDPESILEYVALAEKYTECLNLKNVLVALKAPEDTLWEADKAIIERKVDVDDKKLGLDRLALDKEILS